MDHQWLLDSVQATHALGVKFGKALEGDLTLALVGPLGAGKTRFVKALAQGNATTEAPDVTSPTFTLVHEYPGRVHLYHVDVYRLETSGALYALGWEEWQRPGAVVVIEWADRVRDLLQDDVLWLTFEVTGETSRRLSAMAQGENASGCLSRVVSVNR